MITYIRTSSDNSDFKNLVAELDAELHIRDGKDQIFYAQFNKIDSIKYVIVAYDDKVPVGCGALKEFSENKMEVKRMFVHENKRGKGIASTVLLELEKWAIELHFDTCILETGKKQPEAIGLYTKSNYNLVPNYGQYKNIDNSICFEKKLGKNII